MSTYWESYSQDVILS